MDDRLFTALAEHEKRLAEFIDSNRRLSSGGGDREGRIANISDSSNNNELELIDQSGISQGTIGVMLMNVQGRDSAPPYNPLVVEQPMQFVAHDLPLDAIQKAMDVEPIPFGNMRMPSATLPSPYDPHGQGGASGGDLSPMRRYSFMNNPRASTSALSIDWETLELLHEYDGDRADELNAEANIPPNHIHHHHPQQLQMQQQQQQAFRPADVNVSYNV